MKKYLAIKNAMLTIAVSTMYYKSVFEDITMFKKVFATLVVFIVLMGLLQEADNQFMEAIKHSRKETGNG